MDLSVRGALSLSEDDFRAAAYDVLTGGLKRSQMIDQPNALVVYMGITMMLALRYKISADNRVTGHLDHALCDVILRGKAICQLRKKIVTSGDLRDLAKDMELCRYDPQEKHTILQPPDELTELVEMHRSNRAVSVFKKDMERGIAYHERWLRQLTAWS